METLDNQIITYLLLVNKRLHEQLGGIENRIDNYGEYSVRDKRTLLYDLDRISLTLEAIRTVIEQDIGD